MIEKNLKTIAEKLGLNVATVSRAIRPSTRHLVKAQTRKRILDMMKKEGYKPNIQARDLKSRKSRSISMIIPVGIRSIFYDQYYQSIIQGLNEVIVDTEYSLNILPIKKDYTTDDIFNVLINNETAGMVLSPYCRYMEFPMDIIKKYGFPVISIDNELKGRNIYNIVLDHQEAGRLGAELICAKGRKNIVLISDKGCSPHSEMRKKGFMSFFAKKKGFSLTNVEVPFSSVSGIPALKEIIKKVKTPVSVFSLNDEIAIGMINNIKDLGLNCPDDISILGFDGLSVGEYLNPRLQSVAFPFKKIGISAAEILIKILSGKKAPKKTIIDAGLTEGASLQKM